MPEKILIVEDEIALQETLAYSLKKEGYIVETVGDGRSALEAARRLKPDLIVLDIMLPEIDGFEVARTLRKEMTTAILMLTARDDEIDRGRRSSSAVIERVARAREPPRELTGRHGVDTEAVQVAPERVAVAIVPLGPTLREIADLVAPCGEPPGLRDEVGPVSTFVRPGGELLGDAREDPAVALEPVTPPRAPVRDDGREIEAKTVDPERVVPIPERVDDEVRGERALGVHVGADAVRVDVGSRIVGELVERGVVETTKAVEREGVPPASALRPR